MLLVLYKARDFDLLIKLEDASVRQIPKITFLVFE